MTNELLYRHITSLLVILSLPPLILLLKELYKANRITKKSDVIQGTLLVIYLTFLISGLITLYINIQFAFFHAQTKDYTFLALMRNGIKHIGILFVSWRLYFVTRERK